MSTEITNLKVKKNNGVFNVVVYDEFIIWTAMPEDERERQGISTGLQFAERFGVNNNTLTNWKKRADFKPRVKELRYDWGFNKTPTVLKGMYKSAVQGNALSQSLWLQYMEEFAPKRPGDSNTGPVGDKVEVNVSDIRFIIGGLSNKEDREKYYAVITELLIKADEERRAGLFEDSYRTDGAEGEILDETDITPPNLPIAGTNELPARYSPSVCDDMERKVSKSHYQSAERWWQE